ncbi:MAG: SRPBCC domain-containing protein [Candidatus Methylumidiphilus sp.]
MTQSFDIHRQIPLPATPAEVWEAVATGAGNLGWLFPMEIEPWVGGLVSRGPGKVAVWNPPHAFSSRHESDAVTASLSYRIEAAENGSVLYPHVHRTYNQPIENFAGQQDAAEAYSDFYYHTLGEYLGHFKGRPAICVQVYGGKDSRGPDAFTVLQRALGLTDGVKVGDALRIAPAGLPPVDVVVDYLDERFLGLRGAEGLYRFFAGNHWGASVWLSLHLFAENLEADAISAAWQDWILGIYA